MSKIVSVYSHHSSRDPAGVDPSGADVIHGADPPPDEDYESDPPILPPVSPAGPPPPTPRRIHSGYHSGIRAPSPVMAFLVGDPPPPPPTPPPQKFRSASSRRHHNVPVSPPGDSSTTTGYSSLSSAIRHPKNNGRREPRDPVESNSNTSTYIDQMRLEALAIYESPDLYMETKYDEDDEPELAPEPRGFEQQVADNYSFHSIYNHNNNNNDATVLHSGPAVTNTHLVDEEIANNPNPMAALASPRSAATEPHSNKRTTSRRNPKRAGNDTQEEQHSTESSAKAGKLLQKAKSIDGTVSSAKKRRGRESSGATTVNNNSRGSKTPERRGRGRSVEKRAETPEREKRGFFQKLFRGGKKKSNADQDEEHTNDTADADATKTKTKTTGKSETLDDVLPQESDTNESQKVAFNDGGANKPQSHGQKAVPNVARVDTSQKNRHIQVHTSPRNDADDELDLGLGLDTVTSGLTNDVEPDRRDIFFAHDEVSTLTAPSAHSYGRRSVDPIEATVMSEMSSEPVGRYWNEGNKSTPEATKRLSSPTNDPFAEPFFKEPDGESPITSKHVPTLKTKTKLQVHVHPTQDPAGEAPRAKRSNTHMNEPSPRGWISPITELKDPLGSTMSESASKRSNSGFGKQKIAQPPKIPPGPITPHELRREPSAFRDGSPYALDPPLRVHEGDEIDNKSLVDILSRTSPTGSNKNIDRVAVEPPTPSLMFGPSECQPPTPSFHSVRSQEMEKQQRSQSSTKPTPSTREPEKKQTHLQNVNEKDQNNAILSSNERAKSPKKVGPEKNQNNPVGSPDESGFLDDLFEEKPKTQKRPSIVRPITINSSSKQVGKPTTTEDGVGSPKQSPKSQVIEIHRTQRLSGSPRSNKATSRGHKGHSNIPSPPVSPPKYNKRRALHGDEEKKEQEHELSFSVREESPNKSMLATSTAALSTAACMNAKTVAYLHTLNGEPSPRHSWRRADLSDEEYSPIKSEHQRKAVTNIKVAMSKKRTVAMCRTDEAAFDTFIASAPLQTPPNAQGGHNKSVLSVSKASLSVHSSVITSSAPQKTQMIRQNSGRGRTTIAATKSKPSTSTASFLKNPKNQIRGKYGALSPRSRKAARANFKRPVYWFRFSRDVRVSGAPLAYGLDLLRKKREEDVINGLITPAYRTKKAKPKKKPNASSFQSLRDEDIKDPIQRAGRRLLSKAAIPIQCSARKYLARREASSRLQANIVLQSYFRRWKCEAFLRAFKHASIKIQAAFRSWLVREEITYQHYNATLIQKIVRGYIAAAYVYDTIYWVSRLQAAMRGKLARVRFANQKKVRKRSALHLQAWYRGCNARSEATTRRTAACSIQACYRSYAAQIKYQTTVADIITTQSASRRFLAKKELDRRRLMSMNEAACKIQGAWRGFQGYTDYIFALVDILVLQRSMRKWLAIKKVDAMRRERAAIKIQSQWRRQQALIGMLYDLVHIIIAQSVVRRFLAKKVLPLKRKEYSRRMRRQQRLDSAATKIQTAWRGFWGYSHFIIMQYEIIRLQAIVRGRASRVLFSLKLGCCIMIQSAVRRFLATKKALQLKFDRVALNGEVEGMRMKFACQKVQFWWRVVIECSKEKRAALVIERFFLMVKAEVDKEIVRQRQIHQTQVPKRGKLSHTQEGANDPDDKLLERVWLNTVDEDHVDIFACTSQENGGTASSGRSRSASRLYQNNPSYFSEPSRGGTPTGVKHHPSSPTMNLVMRHEYDEPGKRRELELQARKQEALRASRRVQKSNKPPPDVTLARSDERTEVSAITSPTVFNKSSKGKQGTTKQRPKYQHHFDDELSVDDSLFGEELVDSNQKQMQSAPNNWSKKHHFFSEETKPGKKQPKGKPVARRHHSTSSIASGSDASDWPSQLYSRTATTITRTTASHSHTETMDSMGLSPRSECNTDLDMRKNINQVLASPLVDQKYGSDKYMSAASKGRKLLENVRKGASNNFATIKRSGSPRHGNIVVTNRNDFPILSQDSRDNVEVEYVGEQFGVI